MNAKRLKLLLDIPREQARALGRETVDILRARVYTSMSGNRVIL